MHTVTVDLIQVETVVREGGDAVRGILESINLPVLSTPIRRAGRALIDGGLINNMPADVLVSKEAIPKIRNLLNRLDDKLFPLPALQ